MDRTETITVLFTDLVGSTEQSSRLGPAAAEELRSVHFGLLREAITNAGGREVKNLGDGLMAVFSSTKAALDAAVRMQTSIATHNRRSDETISVRIGIAHGDASEESGDYFGEPVVEAARLCAAAQGDQILAADAVRFMARRSGHVFITERELELKGLPEPVVAWDVAWEAPEDVASTGGAALPRRLAHRPTVSVIGRHHERDVISAAFKAAFSGEDQRLVLVTGEAGIGKSTLVAEVARGCHSRGVAVLCGRCDEDLGIPYRPFVEAIGEYVAAVPNALSALDEDQMHALGRVVPEAHRRGEGVRASVDVEADTERWMMYSAITSVLERAGEGGGALLVLEDLHWADRPTLGLLKHLVASLQGGVLVVATYRDTVLSAGHPLTEALAGFARQEGVTKVSVGGLADDEVADFVEAAAGHDLDEQGVALAHALYRETDGNPFFLVEVLRHLVETRAIVQSDGGRWVPTASLTEVGLPDSVRQVIGARIGRLGPEATAVLSAAAVIGTEFDLELLAAVVGRDEDDVLDFLERSAQAALTTEVAGTVGRFRFVHTLIQHTLYEDLGATRRARLHHKVATFLEALCGDDPGGRVGELARHHLAATRPDDLGRTVALVQMAGEAALDALAPDDAIRWFNQGLDVLGATGSPAERAQLLCGLGRAQQHAGDPVFRQTLLDAGRLARQAGSVDILVASVLANTRSYSAVTGVVDEERVAMVESALDALGTGDAATRARLLGQLALLLSYDADHSARRAAADEALSLARNSGDEAATMDVLLLRNYPMSVPEVFDQLYAEALEAEVLAGRVGNVSHRQVAALFHMYAAMQAGTFSEVAACVEVVEEVAEQTGLPTYRWSAALYRAVWMLTTGDAEGAERLAGEALELSQQTGQPDAMSIYGAQLVGIRWHQGRLSEIADLIAGVAESNPTIRTFRAGLARTYIESGREDEARHVLEAEARSGFDHPDDRLILTYLCQCAEAAVWLDDRTSAARLYERLAPWPQYVGSTGVSHYGFVAHYLGALATVLGHYEDAEAHLAWALSAHESIPAPFFAARTNLEWAKMLRARRGPGDLDGAAQHAGAALEAARRYGCAVVQRRAEALLSAL